MKKKITCQIRNWPDYNASLKKRGSLTIWVSSDAIANWTTDELTGDRGASPIYTDLAIETMATVQAIYGLAGRQTQGFLQSVFELMKLNLTVPDHSTLSRRRRQLEITLPVKNLSNSVHLVIDSTGVKVYGEGEWKVRQHGVGKRRTWRKLHFGVDEATLEIVSVVASANDVSDAEALPDLLEDVPVEIEQVSADGAISGNATTRSTNTARRPPSHHAKAQRSGATQTQRPNAMCETRIYGASEKSGVRSGNGRATIIAGAWRRLRSSASRRSSAIGCKLARLIINSKS